MRQLRAFRTKTIFIMLMPLLVACNSVKPTDDAATKSIIENIGSIEEDNFDNTGESMDETSDIKAIVENTDNAEESVERGYYSISFIDKSDYTDWPWDEFSFNVLQIKDMPEEKWSFETAINRKIIEEMTIPRPNC